MTTLGTACLPVPQRAVDSLGATVDNSYARSCARVYPVFIPVLINELSTGQEVV